MNMANWVDQVLYTTQKDMFRRYTVCLYYGVLNIG